MSQSEKGKATASYRDRFSGIVSWFGRSANQILVAGLGGVLAWILIDHFFSANRNEMPRPQARPPGSAQPLQTSPVQRGSARSADALEIAEPRLVLDPPDRLGQRRATLELTFRNASEQEQMFFVTSVSVWLPSPTAAPIQIHDIPQEIFCSGSMSIADCRAQSKTPIVIAPRGSTTRILATTVRGIPAEQSGQIGGVRASVTLLYEDGPATVESARP
jgi:hypothetical protein